MIGNSSDIKTKLCYSKRSLDDWLSSSSVTVIDIKFAINPDDTNKTWFMIIYQQ